MARFYPTADELPQASLNIHPSEALDFLTRCIKVKAVISLIYVAIYKKNLYVQVYTGEKRIDDHIQSQFLSINETI